MGTILQPESNRNQELIALQQRVWNTKKTQRRRLAALPFDEKYKLLISMQRRSQAIFASRGKKRRVWPEDD